MSMKFIAPYDVSGLSTLYIILTRDADGFYVIDNAETCQAAPPAIWPSLTENAVKKCQYEFLVAALDMGIYSGIVYNQMGGSQDPDTDEPIAFLKEQVAEGEIIVAPFAAPPSAGMQTLYGNVRRLNWAASTGDIVKAVISENNQIVSGALIQNYTLECAIDVNSQFYFYVPFNTRIRIDTPHHGKHEFTTDSTAGDKDITEYL